MQLEPFSQDRRVPKYLVGPVGREEKLRFLSFYFKKEEKEPPTTTEQFEAYYQKYGRDWNGNQYEKRDGQWQEFSTYNPDSKWDWFVEGGRWSGMLMLKKGVRATSDMLGRRGVMDETTDEELLSQRRVDQALKKDIDWKGMYNANLYERVETYDKFEKLIGEPVDDKTLDTCSKWWKENQFANPVYPQKPKEKYDSLDSLIKDHWRKQCARDTGLISLFSPSEIPTRDEFLADTPTICTHSVLRDGEWIEKGEMGWFGVSSESEDESREWNESFFDRFIKPLDEDTLLTIIDCHI